MNILLEAPILTRSGYGEHSRFVYRSLKLTEGIQIFVNPLNWGQTKWLTEQSPEKEEIDKDIDSFRRYFEHCKANNTQMSFDLQIHVGIPNEFKKKAPKSICVTAGIETDRVSPEWLIRTHQGIDKMIVPSEHAKFGFEKTSYEMINETKNEKTIVGCNCPIDVVPYPVKDIQPEHLDFTLETEFNFLSVALLGPRKNLENMVRWFVTEFKDENVGLVLKTGRSSGSLMDREVTFKVLKNVINNNKDTKCKVYLLHGDLSDEQIHSLYQREDIHAYITATHGEGYGLPIFEAAYSGLPIVATDWSGHLDFLSGEIKENKKNKIKKLFAKVDYTVSEIPKAAVWKDILVEGSRWAHPKEQSFRKQMSNVYKNHGMYKKWSEILKNTLLETHNYEHVLKKMNQSIFEDQTMTTQNANVEEEIMVL